MQWRLLTLLVLTLAVTVTGAGADRRRAKLLSEGTLFQGVDGTVTYDDANDVWHFELAEDVNGVGDVTIAQSGDRFELLPSAILENLIAEVDRRQDPSYRLTATVTAFRGRNYLFPSYQLPLSKLKDAAPVEPNQPDGADVPRLHDRRSDVARAIPPEVLAKLQDRDVPRESPAARPLKPGYVLVDRIGIVNIRDGRAVFVPYALGWSIGAGPYELLPCRTLESVLARQAAAPEPLRFSAAGLVTEFEGRPYLLLQRAIRAYSYGNFGR